MKQLKKLNNLRGCRVSHINYSQLSLIVVRLNVFLWVMLTGDHVKNVKISFDSRETIVNESRGERREEKNLPTTKFDTRKIKRTTKKFLIARRKSMIKSSMNCNSNENRRNLHVNRLDGNFPSPFRFCFCHFSRSRFFGSCYRFSSCTFRIHISPAMSVYAGSMYGIYFFSSASAKLAHFIFFLFRAEMLRLSRQSGAKDDAMPTVGVLLR